MISQLTGEPVTDPLLAEVRRDEHKRVQDIRAALTPEGGGTADDLLEFATRFAARFDCTVYTDPDACAFSGRRVVLCPPIQTDADLAVMAHEIGHVQTQGLDDPARYLVGRSSISLVDECAAWRWAIQTLGHRWNKTMQAEMASCLHSYQPFVVKTIEDLAVLEQVIAEGAEATRHVVRIQR